MRRYRVHSRLSSKLSYPPVPPRQATEDGVLCAFVVFDEYMVDSHPNRVPLTAVNTTPPAALGEAAQRAWHEVHGRHAWKKTSSMKVCSITSVPYTGMVVLTVSPGSSRLSSTTRSPRSSSTTTLSW